MYTNTVDGKIDYLKTTLEHLKHIGTVSISLLVVIPTLLVKVFPNSSWDSLAVVSLCIFAFTVLTSIYSYVYLVDAMQYQNDRKEHFLHSTPNGSSVQWGILATWISFASGVVSFVIFSLLSI